MGKENAVNLKVLNKGKFQLFPKQMRHLQMSNSPNRYSSLDGCHFTGATHLHVLHDEISLKQTLKKFLLHALHVKDR